ncbi:hypothetical protein DSO57_1025743 [Entomophthora muscae]|uniref:Uncharacterized protein n=1 Tax=Entomophthora muscae TaxID=34485 RepID=A0ACC2RGV4_9FUNG|nr:hypothetical protein DSO57_1025743 [Entomophthora muscae]
MAAQTGVQREDTSLNSSTSYLQEAKEHTWKHAPEVLAYPRGGLRLLFGIEEWGDVVPTKKFRVQTMEKQVKVIAGEALYQAFACSKEILGCAKKVLEKMKEASGTVLNFI